MDVPIVVVCFNNYRYVENTLNQIRRINGDYYKNIIIMDNCSTDLDTVEYLKTVDVKIIHNHTNSGPWIGTMSAHANINTNKHVYDTLPDKYILTDPDMELNEKLPVNFIEILSNLSDKYKCHKIGFALDISDYDDMYKTTYFYGKTIYDWEMQFWQDNLGDTEYELYKSPIDTTFCLINKNIPIDFYNSIRIAGNFTAKHLPWYIDNKLFSLYEVYNTYIMMTKHISTISRLILPYVDENYLKINKNGEIFLIKNDAPNSKLSFWREYSNWRNDTFMTLDHFLKKDNIFIDVGSKIGAIGIYASRKSKRVYCIESGTDDFVCLNENFKTNCEKNYTLIRERMGKENITIVYDIIEQNRKSQIDVSVIHVDLDGTEENIIEEIYNIHKTYSIPLYVRFCYTEWKDQNLDRFAFLTREQKDKIICDSNCYILFT